MVASPAAPAARFDEPAHEGLDPAAQPAPGRQPGRLSANVVWNLGSDLAARGASLWLAFFCARVLTVPGFGLFAFAQAAGQYAWLPGDAVLNSGYATREIARARHDPRRTAWDFYGARVSAAVALTAVYVAAVQALPLPPEQRGVLLAASLFFVSYALFPDWAARGLQDFRALAAGNLAVAAALVASTWLLLRPHPGAPLATALWASSFAAGALVLAPLLARSFRLLPAHFAPRGWLRRARGSAVFSIGAALAVAIGQAPTLLLGILCPAREVGLFAAGFRLVSTGLGLLAVLWWPVFPVLSTTAPSSPPFREVFRAFFTLMLGLSLPAALALAVFPGEILQALFGRAYGEGAGVLRLLAWALPLFAAVTVLEITLLATGGEASRVRVHALALATLVGAMLAVGQHHGALGAAAALLAGLAVALAGFAVALRGTLRAEWVASPLTRILSANLAAGAFWLIARHADMGPAPVQAALGIIVYAACAVALGLGPAGLWRSLRADRPSSAPGSSSSLEGMDRC